MAKPETHRAHLAHLLDLIAEERFAPVMDRTYPFTDLVEPVYVATGHKRGNVVVCDEATVSATTKVTQENEIEITPEKRTTLLWEQTTWTLPCVSTSALKK